VAAPPLVVIVSGPSGVGKDAVLARIRERTDNFGVPVTMTTRAPREGEIDGREYIFVTPEAFRRALEAGELLEHAEVYGNFYGVPRSQLRDVLAAGRDVIMRVDVQGAATLRRLLPGALFIFLAPPEPAVLEARLRARGDDPSTLPARAAAVPQEMAASADFDQVVINDDGDLEAAVERVLEIVAAERARPGRAAVQV
jgi:guanylate kinase